MRLKILFFLLSVLVLSSCKSITGEEETQNSEYSRSEFILGTIVSIKLLEGGSETILNEAFGRLKEIEDRMSVNLTGSDVSLLNEASGKSPINEPMPFVKVSQDVMSVIEGAIYYGDLSDGAFDITMGPIIDAWQIGTDEAHIPSAHEIAEKILLVDYQKIELDKDAASVRMAPHMRMNLGGIAKGYAADQVEELLVSAGVSKAIINLGGNVKVIGEKEDNLPFKIGIQNPFDERNDYLGIVEVVDQTVVTSGDYERYFEEDGVRYHHIFDATGYPVVTDVASVTVVATSSMEADALSTVLFVYGVEKGLVLVNQIDDVECIFVTKNNEVHLSSEDLGSNFRLTDETFRLIENK